MIAPIMGPIVGGITIDASSWRELFFIPLPIAGVAMLMGAFFMPSRDSSLKRLPFDWTGYALIASALVLLLTAIANGQRDGWVSNRILLMGGSGIVLSIAFVWSQLKSDAPILILMSFAIRNSPRPVLDLSSARATSRQPTSFRFSSKRFRISHRHGPGW